MIPSLDIMHYTRHNSFLDHRMANYLAKSAQHLFVALENGKIYQTDLQGQHQLVFESPDSTPNIQLMRYDTAHELLCFADNRLWIYDQAQVRPLSSNLEYQPRDWVVLNPKIHLLAHAQGLALVALENLPDSLSQWLPPPIPNHIHQDIFDQGVQQCLYLPQQQMLWLVTTQGQLFYSHRKTWKQASFAQQGVFVRNICTDQEQVYVGTAAHGILAFSKDGRYLDDYNADWAIGPQITHLFCAQDGVLWCKVETQLIGMDPVKQNLWMYDAYDGLSLDQVNDFGQFGHLLTLATNQGLITFPQKRSFKYQAPIPIYLEEFISDQDTFLSLPAEVIQASVPHRIELKIGGISYRSRGRIYTYYKLSGSDMSNAQHLGTRREFIQQFNRSGRYTLEAKIRNGNHTYSLLQPAIQIQVNLPWLVTNRWWIILIIVFIVVVIVSFGVHFKIKNQKLKKEKISSQLDAIRAQMNPHFLFNSLNTIQNYIYNNDKDKAIFFLGRFSSLMREVLNMSNREYISLEEELKHLEDYLQLEQMRFSGALEYHIQVDPELDANYLNLPPMLLQPYVENAIKHGLWHKKEGKKLLQIRFYPISEIMLGVEILDNGIGRKKAQEIQKNQPKTHQPYASQATKNRIDLLNQLNQQDKKYEGKFVLDIEDLYDAQGQALGTKVLLFVPL
jgi:hypothetical protein